MNFSGWIADGEFVQVDTTFQKGMMRVITTVIGGVLGYLVMLDTGLATNPYGLMAISVVFAFLCGLLALGPLKYGQIHTRATPHTVQSVQFSPQCLSQAACEANQCNKYMQFHWKELETDEVAMIKGSLALRDNSRSFRSIG